MQYEQLPRAPAAVTSGSDGLDPQMVGLNKLSLL